MYFSEVRIAIPRGPSRLPVPSWLGIFDCLCHAHQLGLNSSVFNVLLCSLALLPGTTRAPKLNNFFSLKRVGGSAPRASPPPSVNSEHVCGSAPHKCCPNL